MESFKKNFLPLVGTLLLPVIAFAQNGNTTVSAPVTSVQGLLNLLCAIFGWMFYGLMALSLIMIVIAAFNYVTSNGSAEKVSTANKMILYAAIGVAVGLLAKGIPLIVANFIGASSSSFYKC